MSSRVLPHLRHSFLCLAISLSSLAGGSHFRGSVIQWRTLGEIVPGADVSVEFTYRIGWRRSYSGGTRCDQSTIDGARLTGIGGDLQCRVGCAGVSSVTALNYFCTDFSTTEDWAVGERSFEFLVPPVPEFEASFTSGDWISLVQGGGNWEVRVKMNFNQTLSAGRSQNASPQTKMSPVIRLQRGCNHTVVIPVEDGDGDDVRCRWAEASMGECAGVCKTFPAELDVRSCTIRYSATDRAGYYAVAVQVEDFASTLDTVAMSSVPLQFLVYVYESDESCYSKPDFDEFTEEDGSCIGVPPNATYHEALTALAGGPGIDIIDITTQSPPGMTKSELDKAQAPNGWLVNVTWTPTPQQVGPNIFCYLAMDSTRRSSDQRCITLLGGVIPPELVQGSQSPTGKIRPDHDTWSLEFDRRIYRPKRTAYFRIFSSKDGQEVFRIDTSSSNTVVFPDPDISNQLVINTGQVDLIEKESYYILLDDGIVAGHEYCGPENSRMWDKSFWTVTIRDVTPPRITFTTAPDFTPANFSIGWVYDENATSVCILHSPGSTVAVRCDNDTYYGLNKTEGDYTLYVQASDSEGNSRQYQHRWYVDLTKPTIRFTYAPQNFSGETDFTFSFYCLDVSSCKFKCSHSSQDYVDCQSRFRLRSLSEGSHTLKVYAIDAVGNIGDAVTHTWSVDTQAPKLTGVNNATVFCGDPITPTALGFPTVVDLLDPNPKVTYFDVAASGCRTLREWEAEDQAGNKDGITQVIAFSNPVPPVISGNRQLYIACGSVDTIYNNEYILDRKLLIVDHPCDRDLDITYQDSAKVEQCGVDITREWTIRDDCDKVSYFTQDIKVLKQSDPDEPEDGQINVPLQQTLRWPQYPGATEYRVYIWPYQGEEPEEHVYLTRYRVYNPAQPYPPNTRLLWRVGYVVIMGNDTREVPSPVWGMTTRPFADIAVTEVMVPSNAFSGTDVTVRWRVENLGNISTSASTHYWYDSVYLGPSTEFRDAGLVKRIEQRRYVDPGDGFLIDTEIRIREAEIGNFYVFIEVDTSRNIEDYTRDNNIITASTPIKVQLTPPPNLIVESIFTLGSSFSGKPSTISWKVKNVGLGITPTTSWSDTVYLSEDLSFDTTDTVLAVVPHTGELITNSYYDASVKVIIPNVVYGAYYIFVVTDVRNEVYEHTGENDNTESIELEIILSPTPDLRVSDLDLSEAKGKTGDTIRISYTVYNRGAGSPFERWWTDQVTITSVDTGRIYYNDKLPAGNLLPPRTSYTKTLLYRIDQSVPSGIYNVSVHADEENYVFEFESDSNNMLSKTVEFEQALPDLDAVEEGVFSFLNAPDSTFLVYNITVSNEGSGHLFGASWVDAVFLSQVEITTKYNIMPIARHRQSDEIKPASSYSITGQDWLIPQSLQGTYFVYLAADYDDDIEEEAETNNFQKVGTITIPIRRGDLILSGVTSIGDSVTAGSLYLIHWEVRNAGNIAITSPWYDSVYLNRGETIDENSILLGRLPQQDPLLSNGMVAENLNITIPLDTAGYYNLVVRTGEYFKKSVESNELNNIYSTGIEILSPPSPNFFIKAVKYEFIEQSGMKSRILSVIVDVINIGNSIMSPLGWSDRVSIIEKSFTTRPIPVVEVHTNITRSLRAQESYSLTHLMVIPAHISGYFDLVVEVDYLNRIIELFGEHNNMWTSKQALNIPRAPFPNLKVQSTQGAPAATDTGTQIELSYTLVNEEGTEIVLTSWTDGAYLNRKPGLTRREILSGAMRIGTAINNVDLKIGETHHTRMSVYLPHGIGGDYYIYIIPDIKDKFNLPGGQMAYNINQPVNMMTGPLPDLAITLSPSNSDTLVSGQVYPLSFTVTNNGNASANDIWYDTLYLSTDPYIDPFDLKLKTATTEQSLLKGGSYQQELAVLMPYDLSASSYYIIAEANIGETLFESNHDNNVHAIVVNLKNAPAVDILTTTVRASKASLVYNEKIDFSWSIVNNGSEDFTGYKCDTVYLSDDDVWDINDVSVSGPTCADVSLQGNLGINSKSFSAATTIPAVTEGLYKSMVRTRSNARDFNLKNNVGVSKSSLNVIPPSIAMGQKKTVTLEENGSLVLKITDVPVDIALLAKLSTANQKAYHQMYLKLSEPPQPFDFEAISTDRQTMEQSAYISFTRGNTYYLLIESISTSSSKYRATIEVKEAKFEITSVYPPHVAPFGTSTLRVRGMLFDQKLEACLYSKGNENSKVCSSKLERMNSETAYATFEMSDVSSGMYAVEMTNLNSGESASLPEALNVYPDIGGKLELELIPPAPLRAGQPAIVSCRVHNVGYTDITTPILVAASGGNSMLVKLDNDPLVQPERSIMFFPFVPNEPAEVLPPRTTRAYTFRVLPATGFVGDERIVVVKAPNKEISRFFKAARMLGKPHNIPQSVWELVYDNLMSCVGPDEEGLISAIRERAGVLNKYSSIGYTVPDIVNNMLLLADGRIANTRIARFADVVDRGSSSVVPLMLERGYMSSIAVRRTRGLFGYGWTSPWLDMKLEVTEENIILMQERREYIFDPSGDRFLSPALRDAYITKSGNFYQFVQSNMAFKFEEITGQLVEIANLLHDDKISIIYGDVLPIKLVHSLGSAIELNHGSHGIVKAILLSSVGLTTMETKYSYNSEGYLTELVTGSAAAYYIYSDNGDLINIQYANGDRQVIKYDSRLLVYGMQIISSSGHTLSNQTYNQNCNGELIFTEHPIGIRSKFSFGIGGVLLAHEPTLGLPVSFRSDPNTHSMSVKIGDNQQSVESYNSEEKVSVRILANGDELKTRFDTNDNIVEVADSVSTIAQISYNVNGLVEKIALADGSARNFHYNNDDRVSELVLEDGSKMNFSYDPKGNVIRRETAYGVLEYSYDQKNRVTMIRNSQGSTIVEYTDEGLPARLVYPDGTFIQYEYNQYQQRARVSTSTGYDTSYHYDSQRRLSSMESNKGEALATFMYDDNGRLSQKKIKNGMYSNYEYEKGSLRLSKLTNLDSSGSVINTFEYEYDARGYRKAMRTGGETITYRYDASGQLTHWESSNGKSEDMTYDKRQNRLFTKTNNGNTVAYNTNAVNQYVEQGSFISYQYDGLGNLIERGEKLGRNTITERYTYDQEKHLTRTENGGIRCEYEHNVFGALSKRTCTDGSSNEYLVDPFAVYGASVLMEVEDGVSKHIYHASEQGLVSTESVDGDNEYFLFNGDGSTVYTANGLGAKLNSYKYDPFGKQIAAAEVTRNPYKFLGKFGTRGMGAQENVYIMGARLYDARLGRFMSMDPIGVTGSPANSYTYANNNPLAYHDPHGLIFIPIIVAGAVIGAVTGAAANAIGQGINIYNNGGNFNYGDLGGAALAGGITGAAITTGAALPAALGGGALATGTGLVVTGAGGYLGGFIGGATSDAINGQPFNVDGAKQNAITNAIGAYLPFSMLRYGGKGASAFGSPFIGQMRPLTPYNPFKPTGQSIWTTLGLGNALGQLPGLYPPSWPFPPWSKPPGDGGPSDECPIPWIQSKDPNDIIGPLGYGDNNFIAALHTMDYMIRFENDENATAPAQRVTIQAPIDDDLDITSFKLGSFGFGDRVVDLKYTSPFHQQMVNDTSQSGTFVFFQAGFDIIKREVTWLLQTVDPETGVPPTDPRVGFLPPNNETSGQGFVKFTIEQETSIKHLARIDATASIVFDENGPIETPPIFHTIDRVVPNASLDMSSAVGSSGGLLVNVLSADSGAGVRSVDIYNIDNSGKLEPLLENVNETTVVIPAHAGEMYKVVLAATDHVGNVQAVDTDTYASVLFNLDCPGNCSGQGMCGSDGICVCHDGYIGHICFEEYTVIEPPIIDISYHNATEDKPIQVHLSARLPVQDITSSLSINVYNIVPSTSFNGKTQQSHAFLASDFGKVILIPPLHFSGLVNFTALAVAAHEGRNFTRELFVSIPVEAVADDPVLHVDTDCYTPKNGNQLSIFIDGKLTDTDGSEVLYLALGSRALSTGENVITLPASLPNNYTLKVSALSRELSNHDSNTIIQEIPVSRCEDMVKPTPTTAAAPDLYAHLSTMFIILPVCCLSLLVLYEA